MKEEVPMKRKIPKKQLIILCGGVTATIILVSLVTLFIRKAGKNDNIAVTKIAEETTVSLDRTTGIEKETTSKETATSTEQVTTERELETTTDKEKTTTEKETETTELIITTTNPSTTVKPTEPVTQPVKEVVTNPPTTVVNNNQYRDPYTGDIISKEEYESIWDEINNPKPTEETRAKNVYVLNDDGTINFKKSKINRPNSNEETEFLSLCKNSNPIKEIIGENLYPYITIFSYSWSSSSSYPTFYACINNEYWLVIGCYDNWNFKQGGDIVLCTNGLPVKNAW